MLDWQHVEDVPHNNRVNHDVDCVEEHEDGTQLLLDDEVVVAGTRYIPLQDGVVTEEEQNEVDDDVDEVEQSDCVDLLHQTPFVVEALHSNHRLAHIMHRVIDVRLLDLVVRHNKHARVLE